MNITRTSIRPQTGTTTTPPPKKEYREAETELFLRESEHYDNVGTYNKRDSIAATVGGVIGLGFTVAGFMNGSIQHGIVGAAPIILGAVTAGGISKMLSKNAVKSSTLPAYQEATQGYREAREEYRESLLQDMNDPSVGEATNNRWTDLKNREVSGDDPIFLMDTHHNYATETMRKEIELLSGLAEGRKAEGWSGQLASLESDPAQFAQQKAFVAQHPNLGAVLNSSQE